MKKDHQCRSGRRHALLLLPALGRVDGAALSVQLYLVAFLMTILLLQMQMSEKLKPAQLPADARPVV